MSYEKKRQGRIRRFGPLIANTITPICQKNGFVQARILLEWDYIVTTQFSQFCTPLKVTFPLKQRSQGRLFLQATSSMATEIAYLEPLILNRINQYFGYQAISKISLLQGPVKTPGFSKTRLAAISPIPLANHIQSCLENHVQPIEDDRLRQALLNLGVSISRGSQKE